MSGAPVALRASAADRVLLAAAEMEAMIVTSGGALRVRRYQGAEIAILGRGIARNEHIKWRRCRRRRNGVKVVHNDNVAGLLGGR